jgi:hypothetical protein
MNPKHELKCKEMTELAERFLPLSEFGFQKSEVLTEPYARIIYDSEKCRIQLLWEGWDMYTGDTVSIYFGRLHAPSDKFTMIWNDEEYHCWHDVKQVVDFLDGLSPQDSIDQLYKHGKAPRVMEEFDKSDIGQSLAFKQPERNVRRHAKVLEYFKERLIDVFDLRRPDLWEDYVDFLRKYYRLKSTGPIPINPPLYKVS